MQSVEHLVWQTQTREEAKKSHKEDLQTRIRFEEYQSDFSFSEDELSTLSFLDVGAGDGAFISYIRNNKKNEHAFALDTEKPAQNPSYFVSGNAMDIPYESHVFDRIVSRNTIHALMFQGSGLVSKTVQELVRITKNGGKILYSMHGPEILENRITHSNELTREQKNSALKRLQTGITEEEQALEYLETLGHKITKYFRNGRKVVTIHIRAVQ